MHILRKISFFIYIFIVQESFSTPFHCRFRYDSERQNWSLSNYGSHGEIYNSTEFLQIYANINRDNTHAKCFFYSKENSMDGLTHEFINKVEVSGKNIRYPDSEDSEDLESRCIFSGDDLVYTTGKKLIEFNGPPDQTFYFDHIVSDTELNLAGISLSFDLDYNECYKGLQRYLEGMTCSP